jgi:hypothetical protein
VGSKEGCELAEEAARIMEEMSQAQIFWIGFTCGLFLGLLIGLIFWELT